MTRKVDARVQKQLYKAILELKDEKEVYLFFEDLCTITEIFSLSQRFEVARMLRKDKTYLTIADETGASTATISRVNRALNYGNNMYNEILDRLGL